MRKSRLDERVWGMLIRKITGTWHSKSKRFINWKKGSQQAKELLDNGELPRKQSRAQSKQQETGLDVLQFSN